MATKVSFNPRTRRVNIIASPVDGRVELNLKEDLYSEGKDDWRTDSTLNVMKFPIEPIGGNVTVRGALGETYILTGGWQIDPDLDQDITVGQTCNYDIPIYGGSGTSEAVAQSGQMPHPGKIPHLHAKVKKVGSPTDSLTVGVYSTLGGTALQETSIDGDLIPTTTPSGEGLYIAFDNPPELAAGTDLYMVFGRSGARDLVNYYEVCADNDVWYGTTFTAWTEASDVWTQQTNRDLCITVSTQVPYELVLSGNIFTDSTLPVSLATANVNVTSEVSTLVELRETDTSGLTAAESAALVLIRKLLANKLITDPTTGELIVYDDDDVTPAYSGNIYEDKDGNQAYRGRGIERRERLT